MRLLLPATPMRLLLPAAAGAAGAKGAVGAPTRLLLLLEPYCCRNAHEALLSLEPMAMGLSLRLPEPPWGLMQLERPWGLMQLERP
jgi:hypothetical protein